ncbi:hypothetical protein [Pseudomonas sp. NPDC007930]|uniref:hypothetical protein n=1 Tax=Pseudomonas sp. NPDC007930 TaxID=3364417 RepID=UPI0036E13D7E
MKHLLAIFALTTLTACATAPNGTPPPSSMRLSISKVVASIDNPDQTFAVQLKLKNGFNTDLKAASVVLIARDRDGQIVRGANLELAAAGALAVSAQSGTLKGTGNTLGHTVGCIEVREVRATMPDYSMRYATGAQALALVDGSRANLCPAEGLAQ